MEPVEKKTEFVLGRLATLFSSMAYIAVTLCAIAAGCAPIQSGIQMATLLTARSAVQVAVYVSYWVV